MKVRQVVLPSGESFSVPQSIQRIDHRSTHGWQLRYGPTTKMFSDFSQDGSGAKASFESATQELLRRIEKLPAPSRLQTEPSANKTSDLPVGISGPIVRRRKNASFRECSFTVLLPRFGQIPQKRSVYIASENTYTTERYNRALEKAIMLRDRAERMYRTAATKSKREEGRALLGGEAGD